MEKNVTKLNAESQRVRSRDWALRRWQWRWDERTTGRSTSRPALRERPREHSSETLQPNAWASHSLPVLTPTSTEVHFPLSFQQLSSTLGGEISGPNKHQKVSHERISTWMVMTAVTPGRRNMPLLFHSMKWMLYPVSTWEKPDSGLKLSNTVGVGTHTHACLKSRLLTTFMLFLYFKDTNLTMSILHFLMQSLWTWNNSLTQYLRSNQNELSLP